MQRTPSQSRKVGSGAGAPAAIEADAGATGGFGRAGTSARRGIRARRSGEGNTQVIVL